MEDVRIDVGAKVKLYLPEFPGGDLKRIVHGTVITINNLENYLVVKHDEFMTCEIITFDLMENARIEIIEQGETIDPVAYIRFYLPKSDKWINLGLTCDEEYLNEAFFQFAEIKKFYDKSKEHENGKD